MPEQERKLTWWQVVMSVLAAMIGIQKNKNRERDFQQGNPLAFILVGIVLTVLFIFALMWVVSVVLSK